MNRLLAWTLLASVTCSLSANGIVATALAQEAPITTVQVTGYNLTRDGGVRPNGSGSATLVTSDGYLVTNAHVATDDSQQPSDVFEVCFSYRSNVAEPRCTATARYVNRDDENDVAILKIDPTDIFGKSVGTLPFLPIDPKVEPEVGTAVTMVGYPDIGLGSVTFTTGIVSGYATINGVRYFKSDAKISHGNSGGTALDAQGRFIGIPSRGESGYSSLETLGYILPIAPYHPWIVSTLAKPLDNGNPEATNELRRHMLSLYEANRTGELRVEGQPAFTLAVPDGWRFGSVSGSALENFSFLGNYTAVSKDGQAYVGVSVSHQIRPPRLDDLERAARKQAKQFNESGQYEVERVMFNGQFPALRTRMQIPDYFFSGNEEHDRVIITYQIPFGTSTIEFAASYTTAKEEWERDVIDIAASFNIVKGSEPDYRVSDYESSTPQVRFSNPDKARWTMARLPSGRESEGFLILLGKDPALSVRDDPSLIQIEYGEYWRYRTDPDLAQYYKEAVENAKRYGTLLSNDDRIVLAGRPAMFITTKQTADSVDGTKEGPRINLSLTVPVGRNVYSFELWSRTDEFEKDLSFFKRLLSTVVFDDTPGKTDLTAIRGLSSIFLDTGGHRFEQAIAALKKDGIVSGYPDRTFRPYRPINRAEFLKIVLASLGDEWQEKRKAFAPGTTQRFSDVAATAWYARDVAFAATEGIVSGYADGSFQPGNTVTLAEALKILLKAHGVRVYEPRPGDDTPWYLPYVDKARELEIPLEGADDPLRPLMRGEAAFLIAASMENIRLSE